MDGVVADYEAMANHVLDKHEPIVPGYKHPAQEWSKIKNFDRFYRNMPLIKGSKNFVNKVLFIARANDYSVKFLTAVPHKNDMPYAFSDKVFWANEHFPNIDVWFGPYSQDKQLRALPNNILIDDRKINIDQWTSAGGIGILFDGNFDETIEKLNKHMRVWC